MFRRVVLHIKASSNATLRSWCYQCESILAQRSRRLQQLFSFYHRVYGSHGLKLLIRSYHRQLPQFKGKNLVLSAVAAVGLATKGPAGSFDWTKERLSLDNFDYCHSDIEFINTLPNNKLCDMCKVNRMKYCYCLVGNKKCPGPKGEESVNACRQRFQFDGNAINGTAVRGSAVIQNAEEQPWKPYISRDHICIWRREERTDMYAYKMYAKFNDISAADLLHVQVDLDYRKEWDNTAVALHMIEEDPIPGTNSHIIYWEMQWPKLFQNRDYVYCRRFICDDQRKVMLVANRGTTHTDYPQYPNKVRVTDYWSLVVIKPFRSFQEPGVHYILTYFDDPGVAIPQSIKSWVSQRQMPESLNSMYHATRKYSYRKALTMKNVFQSFTDMNNEYSANKSRSGWLRSFLTARRKVDSVTPKEN